MTRIFHAVAAFCWASCVLLHSAEIVPLVTTNATWRLCKGRTEASSPDIALWRNTGFADTNFTNAPAPFTYGESYGYGTDMSDMLNQYTCFFLRQNFTVTNKAAIAALRFGAKVDDGFIAWINGVEIQRVNMPGAPGDPVAYTTLSTGAPSEPVPFVFYPLNNAGNYLVNGVNTLAVQVFNTSAGSTDIVFDGSLDALLTDTNAPAIVNVTPAPDTVTSLNAITITFSEPVLGIDADDFLIDGFPADNMVSNGNAFTFTFAQPPFGPVQIGWRATNGITDQAVPPNAFDFSAPSANWFYTLVDVIPPTVTNLYPPVNAVVQNLAEIEVTFSEDVLHVDASDLLINSQPATNVTQSPGGPFVFRFPPAHAGNVSVAWAANHGITDLASSPNAFAGRSWNYTVNPNAVAGDLVINEFLARNESGLLDEDGEEQGWIEILNRGETTVNLANWALSDDPELPGLWSFPSRALGPGEYLVVFASGKDRRAPSGANRFHTNFKLNGNGEHLGLYSPDSPRVLVHGFSKFPEQRNDNSYGYDASGALRYFATPTPGASNSLSSIVGVVAPVHFGVSRGFFTQPFNLTLSSETRGAQIHYTTDGREPTEASALYIEPLRITNNAVIRATAFRTNYLPSVAQTHTYIFNATPAVRSLPVLSLVTASNNLYGPSGIVGISGGTYDGSGVWVPVTTNDYHNTDKHGVAWERPVSIELIRPEDNSGFQVNGGIRAHGSDYTRPRYRPTDKFAYRLYFRGAYGPGKLNYPFFEGSAVQSFDQMILRAGHNDLNPFIRDEMTRRLHEKLGAVTVHGNVVNLFINGNYIGFFNPTERPDENWISSWYQSEQHWDVIKQFNGVVNGDLVEYNNLNSYIRNQDVTQPAIYQEVARRLDLTNFVDYLLLNIYTGMGDWPANNWVMGRERSAQGIWRYYIWDAEWACGIYGRAVSMNTFTLSGGGPDDSGLNSTGSADIARYYQRLYQNPEFRLLFADRIHKHFFNGGTLTDTNISLMHTALRNLMLPVLPSYDNSIATTWIPQRRAVIMGHFDLYGLIATSNAPAFNQFGGRVARGFNLTMLTTNGGGTIYYTTNGGDPRVIFTEAVASNAAVYSSPVVLDETTVVRARTLNGTNWSAATEAKFEVATLGIPLRITELMYNPAGGSIYEFIELQNMGSTPVDLSGMYFEGVTFTFPPNSGLAAGARFVLASDTDPASFAARHPGLAVAGYFAGNLNNAGERITLRDRLGQIVTSVDYDDENGWPAAADGAGYSLEVIDAFGDPDDPANWRTFPQLNGTPGTAPPPIAAPLVLLNEIMATNATSVANGTTHPDWIELRNNGVAAASLDGWSLTDDANPRKFVFPNGTSIPAGGFLVVWCDDATNTTPGLHSGFALKQSGGVVELFDAATNAVDQIGYGLQLTDYAIGRTAGGWALTTPTPNAANIVANIASPTNLVINEWLANALPGLPDWIELYNPAAQPIALRGCWLTTTSAVHQVSSLSFIAAGSHVQLFADESTGADHLDFKLSASGETISLYDPLATLVDSISYTNTAEGVSRGRLPDGSANLVNFIGTASPGAPNYAASYTGPVLNEVLARNVSAVTNAGHAADFIELFNYTGSSFSLAGMSLSADSIEPGQWIFPPGANIGGNGGLVIWCDGARPVSTNTGDYNLGRSLNGDSGGVYLFNASGQLVDSVEYGFQIANQSIGTTAAAGWHLLSSPSPAAANGAFAALGNPSALRVNEWMANPASGPDWFELFNSTNLPIAMSGAVLTDDPTMSGTNQFVVPPLSFIAPAGFVQWVADGHPEQGRNHVSFALDDDGDTIRIYAGNGSTVIDNVAFSSQALGVSQGQLPDGASSPVSFPGSASPGESNFRLLTGVVINEVLSYATPPLEPFIELHNVTSQPFDISGWYVSDSAANLKNLRLANGTTIAAGGFITISDVSFGSPPNSFTLDRARGGELWLSEADAAGNLTGARTRVQFGAASQNVSFGRYETGADIDFVAQSSRTSGASNAGPLIGPVVINEVMYHPPDGVPGATEFIELRNITGAAVDLFDPVRPTNTWRLSGGAWFAFPPGTSIAANGNVLLVDFDPVANPAAIAAFRSYYGASPAVPVFGPYRGKLDNGGDTIELSKPEVPDGTLVPFVLVEKVQYRDRAPWPAGADGGGLSLQRRSSMGYANSAASWLAGPPTAGSANAPGTLAPPSILQPPASATVLVGSSLFLQPAISGSGPLNWQWRFNGAELPGETNSSLLIDYVRLDDAGSYDVFVANAGGVAFSPAAQLTVVQAPSILSGPPALTITNGGSNCTFSVSVNGTAPLWQQWDLNGSAIPGANSPVLSLANLTIENCGDYTFTASNAWGMARRTARLLVAVRPAFTNQPQPQTVLQGGTAVFRVLAGPDHPLVPLAYRWVRGGAAYATSSVPYLVISNCQASTSIRCAVTNLATGLGGLNSSTVTLTVLPDNDGDGMADAWESRYGFDTNDPADALLDLDGDGMSNRDEYLAGTDPADATSVLKLSITTTNAQSLRFVSQSNVTYRIEYRTNLASAPWNTVTEVAPQSLVRTVQVAAPNPPPERERFYRVSVPAPVIP